MTNLLAVLALSACLTLLACITSPVPVNAQPALHIITPSVPPPITPQPHYRTKHTYTHPLLATINYATATSPTAVQPGHLNYYNFTRPEGVREFYLYVPTTYNTQSTYPFTFYFHGYSADYRQGIAQNMTVDAEAAGYLIAFPQGTPATTGYLGWNGGECCLFNDSTTVDDVEFTRVALATVRKAVNVDDTATYAIGWSNGGFMVERLACVMSDVFAGIAADASAVGVLPGGQAGLAWCDGVFGANYTNYFHIHGTADPVISCQPSLHSRSARALYVAASLSHM